MLKSRAMTGLVVFHGKALGRYAFPDPHPFGSDRLPAFWAEFQRRGLERRVRVEPPALCDEASLLTFHTQEYVSLVKEASRKGTGLLDDGDTPAFPGVFEAASAVAGTSLKAVELIMQGPARRAFSPVAGLHHARRDRAGGFCVFNDIGVVIESLRRRHGIRRVSYVDIDVHHGDGVYYEYESDPEVFIADIHEDGRTLYPGTGSAEEKGTGRAEGTKLNLPLPPGAGEEEFLKAFDSAESFIDQSKPEFLLLQCGADGLAGDPIAHLRLTPRCHRHAAERLRELAERHCQGRLFAMGGGGYDRKNLAAAWCEVVEALA